MTELDLNTVIEKNIPDDLDQKWEQWLKELRAIKNKIEIIEEKKTDFGKIVDFYYDSINNTKIHTRLFLSNENLINKKPLVAIFHGAGNKLEDCWNVEHCLKFVNEGHSSIMFSARNQGGKSIDLTDLEFKEHHYLNHGIRNLETNYCKFLYLDAVKLLDICKDSSLELFKDLSKHDIIVTGASQGGELSLAVAALTDYPILCLPDVPSGCAIKERIIYKFGKYNAYNDLKEVFPELDLEPIYKDSGYFDLINLVHNIKCPVYSSVGGKDNICPASYYYEAYKKITTEKYIFIYPDHGHGGFDEIHSPKKLQFIKDFLNR